MISSVIKFGDLFPNAKVVAAQGKAYLYSEEKVDRKSIPESYRLHFYNLPDKGVIIGREPVLEKVPLSTELALIPHLMSDPTDYIIWYGALKGYARCMGGEKK